MVKDEHELEETNSWKKQTERPGPSGHILAGGCGGVPYVVFLGGRDMLTDSRECLECA